MINLFSTNEGKNEPARQPSAGEAGVHAGESPAGRIRQFATERNVRDEAVRPNLQAGSATGSVPNNRHC